MIRSFGFVLVIGVLLDEESAEIDFDLHLLRLALNRLAQYVRVTLGSEEFDDGYFELGFGEFHFFVST
jgi:hypothetical protein